MPLLAVNAGTISGNRAGALRALRSALDGIPQGAPVVFLVHGYKFSPGHALHCPHAHVLSLEARRGGRGISWPRHLGFRRGVPDEGLCIGFGWDARGSIWQAHRRALDAGAQLAVLASEVADRRGVAADVFAHSLGARVALAAIRHLGSHEVGRAILLAGAEFRGVADKTMASPCGRHTQFINVTSRENRLFDLMAECLLQPPGAFDRALGAGIGARPQNWVDLAIDEAPTRAHLAAQGLRIAPPSGRICHWSGYLRPGLFRLYRAILRDRLPLSALHAREACGRRANAAPAGAHPCMPG